ncbi:MAG: hypothetical protein AAF253_00465 [Pseudomonadota bacterium]
MTVIPQNFDEWKHCITVQCGIPLTPSFVETRIKALEDEKDYRTRKFIETWGQAHHAKTLEWFREAATHFNQPGTATDTVQPVPKA